MVGQGDGQPVPELPNPAPTDADRAVARLIAAEVEDGACLQIGIGAMPKAVCSLLMESGVRNLGVHTKMLTDGIIDLYKAGIVAPPTPSPHRRLRVHDRTHPDPPPARHPRTSQATEVVLHPLPSRGQPNETWQSDFTHYPLATAVDVEILTWLDDHSLTALSVTAHLHVTGRIVRDTFRATTAEHGIPASTLTDNGMVYTTRFAGGHGGRNAFEAELVRLHITQKNSRPNHPTTCGKVERFQQTMKRWLRAQPAQPSTIAGLQALLDLFVDEYNHRRPHRSLPHRATLNDTYTTRPKATPTNRIILLAHDLDIRIIDAATGELLRTLTLNPNIDYQPTGAPKGPTRPEK